MALSGLSGLSGMWGGLSSLLTGFIDAWHLEEASGARASVTGSNSLASTNGVGQATGKNGNAAAFVAASSQFLSCADNAALSMGDIDFTLAVWVKLSTTGTFQGIVSKYNNTANQREYLIAYDGTNGLGAGVGMTLTVSATGTSTVKTVRAADAITAGVWYLVVAWHDSVNNTLNIQVNNGTVASVAHTTGVLDGTSNFCIGSQTPAGLNYVNAVVDEQMIWKRLLTTAERTTLWNGGNGLPYPFDTSGIFGLTITNVAAYQTFQRSDATHGSIPVSGTYRGSPTAIEARFNGGTWATLDAAPSGGFFSGTLSGQAAGQGLLETRFANRQSVIGSTAFVGIGDVFVIAGQSNASGRGDNNQVYSHATLKATLYGNDYLWKELVDPSDSATNQVDTVSQPDPAGGSLWPLIATSFLTSQGVPVAFIPCAKGGATMTDWQPGANHQDRTTLYGSMVYRALSTGCKAVLWWQGEADAQNGTAQATYAAGLTTLGDTIFADLGVPLIPVNLQAITTATAPHLAAIQAAITAAWGTGHILTGPDFSDLAPDANGAGVHLTSDAHLATCASRFWVKLQAAFGYA